ncbi:hydroxycarboxylic acid receptor 2-like [Labeo rohita]|uniref:hydroxycarboxylic acid receptor 2-like n=1 Tax=Labeo rohita TaxID=84645 RepID=UPI0021E1E1E2|nr:hydroxycarboxylic acid receptor 2-like [Labeo rohita]
MNNSAVNFTTSETSKDSITDSFWLWEIVKICVFSINVLFGFPTHAYVIWLIISGTGSGVASEFFNLNLSVCEIGTCLNCFLYIVSLCFPSISNLLLFLQGLVFTGRPLFQCLICVERYLAVVHPVTFLKYKSLRYRVICSILSWMICLGSCFFCLFIDFIKHSQINAPVFSLQFLLVLSIQLFCLVAVLRTLKQSGPGERRGDRVEENHMKKRAFHLILISTVSMTIIDVPFIIAGLITILTNQYFNFLWVTGVVCYVAAGFVQPVLYLQRTRKLSCLCV